MIESVALLVAGAKGAQFLPPFLQRLRASNRQIAIELCNSYPSPGLQYDACGLIKQFCDHNSVHFIEGRKSLSIESIKSKLVFLIGWQYLINEIDSRFIVFHDSILPKLRGFNPTVTALICGETRLGATAFRPDGGMDTGPIVAQRSFGVTYPVTVRDVYSKLAMVYVDLAWDVIDASISPKGFVALASDQEPSYSIWRDDDDYLIDWSRSATDLRRFVDSVGWPYLGAKTGCGGEEVRIHRALELPDLTFAVRQPGKLLAVGCSGTEADVVCGSGILRVQDVRTRSGKPFIFERLRTRFG